MSRTLASQGTISALESVLSARQSPQMSVKMMSVYQTLCVANTSMLTGKYAVRWAARSDSNSRMIAIKRMWNRR